MKSADLTEDPPSIQRFELVRPRTCVPRTCVRAPYVRYGVAIQAAVRIAFDFVAEIIPSLMGGDRRRFYKPSVTITQIQMQNAYGSPLGF